MKPKQSDHTKPEVAVPRCLMDSIEKSANKPELMVFIWPPVLQLSSLNDTDRKKFLLIWCIMITLMMLLLAFGIPGQDKPVRKAPVSPPASYPPAQMCG